jgi:S1-C subfamily serine protease
VAVLGVLLLGAAGWMTLFARGGTSETATTVDVESATESSLGGSTTTTEDPGSGAISPADVDWDLIARSVVYIEALSPCEWRGSGTIVLDGSFILTNEHVSSNGRCDLRVGLTTDSSSTPDPTIRAEVVVSDPDIDLAIIRMVDSAGAPLIMDGHEPVSIDYSPIKLGDVVATVGYPALGAPDMGMTITLTRGAFAGFDYADGEFYKTDAEMRGGVSGGGAFDELGKLIGVPTAGLVDAETGDSVGINLIRPIKYAKPLLDAAASGTTSVSAGSGADAEDDAASWGGDSSVDEDDPWFGTCREAKSHGYGPYFRDVDPEYDWYLDRDGDGVVCE